MYLESHSAAVDIYAAIRRLDQDVWLEQCRCLRCRILLGGADVLCKFSPIKCHNVQSCGTIVQDIVEQHYATDGMSPVCIAGLDMRYTQ